MKKFAKDPTARLSWFYARSKFYDDRYLLYPVGSSGEIPLNRSVVRGRACSVLSCDVRAQGPSKLGPYASFRPERKRRIQGRGASSSPCLDSSLRSE